MVLEFPDAAAWEAWLVVEHELQTEAWLRIAKRHSGIPSVTIAEASTSPWLRLDRRPAQAHDRRWEAAYDSQRTVELPPDPAAALADDTRAKAAFDRLGKSDQYAVILPLLKARTPQANARQLARAVARLAAQE